jgi:hypothetical protein
MMTTVITWLCGYCHSRKHQAMPGVPRRQQRHCGAAFKNLGSAAILKSHQLCRWMLTLRALCMIAIVISCPYAQITITVSTTPLPSFVNNSLKQFFRPIFNQQGESCGNASGIAYNFTYQIDCARNLPASVAGNQYPYIYTYNFLNDGSSNNGASHMYVDALNIVKENGVPNVTDWGGFTAGFPTKWMSGYDLYYRAMQNRVDKIDSIDMLSVGGIAKLKQWLYDLGNGSANGGVANFGCSVSGWQFVKIASGPEAGKSICIKYGSDPSYDHGQTIVGYNDSIRYDFNKDGKFTNTVDLNGDGKITMADWEIGAVRVANSWGTNSGIGDGDFYWLPYRMLAMTDVQGGIRNANRVCIATVKQTYTPRMALKISLTDAKRNQIALSVGAAPLPQATQPTKVRSFANQFTYAGGAFPLCGSGGLATIEIGLDISDLIDSIGGAKNATFFLVVQSKGGAGTVNSLSLMDYTSGAVKETKSTQANVAISAAVKTYVGVSSSVSVIAPVNIEKIRRMGFTCNRVKGEIQIRGNWNNVRELFVYGVDGELKASLPVYGAPEFVRLPHELPAGTYVLCCVLAGGNAWIQKVALN